MSNYLQNLIAKSFNHAEVARPRLASRFEPLAHSAATASGEIHPVETFDFERLPGDAQSSNTRQKNRQGMSLKKDLRLPTMSQSSKELETPVWRGNQQLETLEQKTAEAQILQHQTMLQNQIDFQSSTPQASENAPQENNSPKPHFSNLKEFKTQTTRQRNDAASPEDALFSGHALMQKEQIIPSRQRLQPHSKISVPTPMQNESAQIRRPINGQLAKHEMKESFLAYLTGALETNKVTVQPRIALPVENQRASGKVKPFHQQSLAPQAEISAPPTINVTIGRIEVRATTAAAQPRKPPPVAQTMSLDEYLRKRNQGGAE